MLSKDYILGLVEGEGCFNIAINKYIDRRARKTGRKNNIKNPYLLRVRPNFRITQVVEDGYDVLKEVQQTFGFGKFQHQKRAFEDGRQRDIVHFYVQRFEDCLKVKEYFEGMKFHTVKGKSFEKWGQCLDLIQQGKHTTKEGIMEICDLRDTMNYRKTKCKWTKEEVLKVLEQKPVHQTTHFDLEQQSLLHNNNIDMFDYLLRKQGNNKKSREMPEIKVKNH
jgi:hypothetical protein